MTTAMETIVTFDYTNHRGVKGRRTVVPLSLYWGSNEWHTTPQYLMDAWDVDKTTKRTFAIKDIRNWTPYEKPKPVRELSPEEYEAKVKAGKKIRLAKGGEH